MDPHHTIKLEAWTRGAGNSQDIGDGSLRVRTIPNPTQVNDTDGVQGPGPWMSFRTAVKGTAPLSHLPPNAFAGATVALEPTSADGQSRSAAAKVEGVSSAQMLSLTRFWQLGNGGKSLVMRFRLQNNGSGHVELGSFGMALPFPWNAGTPAGDEQVSRHVIHAVFKN